MTRKRPETAIHRNIVKHLRLRGKPGLLWWHTPNGAFYGIKQARLFASLGLLPGVSDLILVYQGKVYGLEIKAPKGRPTESQLKFASDLNAAGGYSFIAEGQDEALRALEYWGLICGKTT